MLVSCMSESLVSIIGAMSLSLAAQGACSPNVVALAKFSLKIIGNPANMDGHGWKC